MKHCPPEKLSADEKRRNAFGKVVCYRYDATCTDTIISPVKNIGIPDVAASHSSVTIIEHQRSSGEPFKPVLIPGTRIPYPGFPSLNVIPIATTELIPIGLNCFGSASKYPTMLLSLYQIPSYPPLEVLAENILGKSVYVNWPMMHEGQVVAISDDTKSIKIVKGKRKVTVFDRIAADRWASDAETMYQMYYTGNGVPGSGGVNIGEIKVRLKLLPLQGMRTNTANGATKKLFGREEADVPLQLALLQAPAPDPRFIERGPMTLEERFPVGCNVVLTKGKYRGCSGRVAGYADTKCVGVKVDTIPPELPFGLAIARTVQETYISSVDAARILKMPTGLFGKVTGRLQFEQGKYDLGLNLKSADGSCVVGYTRKKVEAQSAHGKDNAWSAGDSLLVVGSARSTKSDEANEERMQWEYTPKAVRLVQEYREKFPQLFAEIKKNPNEKKYDARKVFGPNGEAWLPVIREWLDKHETAKLPRSPVTSESMSSEAVAAVQKAADVRSLALKKKGYPKESLIKIPAAALYREGATGATDVILASDLGNDRPELGDRIVNLCADGIPFGARGTVVAVHESSTTAGCVEVVMDEEFIGGTSLQGACSNFRGKLCVWSSLLKVVPENSKGLVDRLVPKGVGRAAVEKIMSSIEREVKNSKALKIQSSWDATVDAGVLATAGAGNVENAPPAPEQHLQNQIKSSNNQAPVVATPKTTPTPRSAPRTGSVGRGRQSTWREAKGPDGTNGFKGARKGKPGIVRWKNLTRGKQSEPKESQNAGEKAELNSSSAALKSMLGLTSNSANSKPSESTPAASCVNDTLKAMLGVQQSSVSAPTQAPAQPAAFSEAADAAAGLKALLGVASTNHSTANEHQEAPASAPTAADHLLRLMASKQSIPPARVPAYHAQSAFNFTYVEEGKEAPLPPPPQHLGPPYGMSPAYQFQGFSPMGLPSGAMPMPPVPMQPYGYPANMGYPMNPNERMPAQFSTHAGGHPGLSEKDFPPLGAQPDAAPTVESVAPKMEEAQPSANPSVIVPSVVAAKRKQVKHK